MNFYISDLHLGHSNIIRLNNRPFKDAIEMETTIINNWNNRVREDDNVYIIGDFCYKSAQSPEYYLKQLKGNKYLITGNHDRHLLNNPDIKKYFKQITPILFIKDNDKSVILCHYPMIEWDGMYRDTWHIYGHIHNNTNDTYEILTKYRLKALNAGVDVNNFMPVSFEELIVNNKNFQKANTIIIR